jgi:hypothetical protein
MISFWHPWNIHPQKGDPSQIERGLAILKVLFQLFMCTCCCPPRRIASARSGMRFPYVMSSWPTHPNCIVSTRDCWPLTLALPDRCPLQERSLRASRSPVLQACSLENRIPPQFLHLCRPLQESAIDNRNSLNDVPLACSNPGFVPLNHRRTIHKCDRPAIFEGFVPVG